MSTPGQTGASKPVQTPPAVEGGAVPAPGGAMGSPTAPQPGDAGRATAPQPGDAGRAPAPPRSRPDLVTAVLRATSAIASQGAMFSQLVAERLGLAATDVEVLEVLADAGRMTAGRLSELTGLTSGATTRLIDRLEQAGYVRRLADPADRRRVLVEAVPDRLKAVGPFYDSLARATESLLARYSEGDLSRLADFLDDSAGVTRAAIARLREPALEAASAATAHVAPRGPTESGRLVVLSGAPFVEIRGDRTLGTDLYRASFDGPVPRVRSRGGVVTVHYGRLSWLDLRARIAGQNLDASVHWRRDRAAFALNASMPWAIELRGGVSKIGADLGAIALESFELRGGASRVEIALGQPTGIVPVRVAGGLSRLSVWRPAGTPIRLSVRGAGHVYLDGQEVGWGNVVTETPGASQQPARFELEASGGASRVTVDTR